MSCPINSAAPMADLNQSMESFGQSARMATQHSSPVVNQDSEKPEINPKDSQAGDAVMPPEAISSGSLVSSVPDRYEFRGDLLVLPPKPSRQASAKEPVSIPKSQTSTVVNSAHAGGRGEQFQRVVSFVKVAAPYAIGAGAALLFFAAIEWLTIVETCELGF